MKSLDDIAVQLQGYDPQSLSVNQVHAFLNALVHPLDSSDDVHCYVAKALGCVLAQDAISPLDVPPHDNSAMDGFAFSFQDHPQVATQATQLRVVGTALAGKAWTGTIKAGECLRIMTGAILPDGLDTVVPQEMIELGDNTITIPAGRFKAGDNRRLKGEDIEQGKAALKKGQRISPAALGLIASLGLPTVRVKRKLRVAYFSTGSEILSLGEPVREGAVYDSNRYTVMGMLTRLGCEVIDMGVVIDDPVLLRQAFVNASQRADAVITSGGVSVGEADFTKAMMRELGDVAFWKIAMRPGRPMAVGRMGSSILFGLPGNPVSVMVTFLAFVRPALLRMMGSTETAPPYLKAKSLEVMRKKPGRTEYQRGFVSVDTHGQLKVQTTGNQGSGVLSSMVMGNGLIVLHHDQGNVAVGEAVDVMMFDGVI
ncbi:MAG: molybdopterin molybdenumtransferase MoeA [Limnohabitans sp.]|nr:molybdopterin molybdenumtransferase MoeA [Limnohabitans sp.]